MHKLDFFEQNGFAIVKKFLSRKKCNEIIDKLKNIKKIRKKKNLFVGDARTEVIFNFFFEDLSLLKLISNKTIDKFMKKKLDKYYVLQVNSARNVIFSKKNNKRAPGYRWHKDNRFINKINIKPTLLYSIIICLDQFNEFNGATDYIPNSHKYYGLFKRRQNKEKVKKIKANKGDLIFLHGNLLHRVGKNLRSNTSRWSIFAFYTPWWIKPSVNYKELMSKHFKQLNELDKKILHFESTPTENIKAFSREFISSNKGVNAKKN
jgi:ectoine hydroxylase-related dioxygenase (phytanoyl-CoA dioxygenase family)